MVLRRMLSAGLAAACVSSVLAVAALPASAAAEEVVERPPDGVFVVDGHGYGHGRGMSQWGAQGAAGAGVSFRAILDTYYPGTTQTGGAAGNVRVLISVDDSVDTTVAAVSGLSVTAGSCSQSTLPAGPAFWRVVVAGGALRIESGDGSSWSAYTSCGSSLGATVTFDVPPPASSESLVPVTLVLPSGATRDYRGVVRATLASKTSLATVNVLPLEDYVRGVVPRENPPSFNSEALRAQAVASRTVAVYSRNLAAAPALWDICDTSECQEYAGIRESEGGVVTQFEQDTTDNAVSTTAGVIRTYRGAAISADYSASNGGWSAPSSLPYLKARADPYDGRDGSNTSYTWTASVPVTAIEAAYPALGRLARVRVKGRDGHGEWGGRVGGVVLEGKNSRGRATSVTIDGTAFMRVLEWPGDESGMRSAWWRLRPVYDARVVARSAGPTLVRPPAAAAPSYVDVTNTGVATWDPAALRLTRASAPGGREPLAGGSTAPGVFVANLSTGDGSAVQPGQAARLRVGWNVGRVAAGSYHPAYRLMLGSNVFGPVIRWNVAVKEPVFAAKVTGTPTLAAGSVVPAFSPEPVQRGGGVALARTGRTTVRLAFRNTGNLAWPLRGPVRVATGGPHNRRTLVYGRGWLSPTRAARISGVVGKPDATEVAPGEVAFADVTLWGNNRPAGTVKETFDLVWEGVHWLNAPVTLLVTRVDMRVPRAAERAPSRGDVRLVDHPGGTTTLTFRLRNIGASPWPVGGTDVLGVGTAKDRTPLLRTRAWLSPTLATPLAANASRDSALVYPGEVGEWRVPVSAFRKAPGVYSGTLRAIDTGSRVWYGPALTTRVTVVRGAFSGAVTGASNAIVVPRTGSRPVYVDVRNTGNFVWKVGGPVRLAVVGRGGSGAHADGWLNPRRPAGISANVSAQGQPVVRPGQVARFTFRLAGNGRGRGNYAETFAVVWDGWKPASVRATVRYVVR